MLKILVDLLFGIQNRIKTLFFIFLSLDGAGVEKNRLEEKQRAARRERKKSKGDWKPR